MNPCPLINFCTFVIIFVCYLKSVSCTFFLFSHCSVSRRMSFILRYLPWTLLHRDQKEPPDEVDFILIGAGLPRTGTKSTQAALSLLLPGKCHHMSSVVTCTTGQNAAFWMKAVDGTASDEDWKMFMKAEGLSAVVDYPSAYFWRKLLQLYPNAKVMLTDRDPVTWHHSVKNTIYRGCQLLLTPPYSTTISLLARLITDARNLQVPPRVGFAPVGQFARGLFGAVESGEEAAVKFYSSWKAAVIAEVPEDRLLIFQVKDGWNPLCKFLGVEIPSIPFPRMNDTNEVRKMNRMTKHICHGIWTFMALIASVFFYNI